MNEKTNKVEWDTCETAKHQSQVSEELNRLFSAAEANKSLSLTLQDKLDGVLRQELCGDKVAAEPEQERVHLANQLREVRYLIESAARLKDSMISRLEL